MTMIPAIMALVVAMAGIMLPAIDFTCNRRDGAAKKRMRIDSVTIPASSTFELRN